MRKELVDLPFGHHKDHRPERLPGRIAIQVPRRRVSPDLARKLVQGRRHWLLGVAALPLRRRHMRCLAVRLHNKVLFLPNKHPAQMPQRPVRRCKPLLVLSRQQRLPAQHPVPLQRRLVQDLSVPDPERCACGLPSEHRVRRPDPAALRRRLLRRPDLGLSAHRELPGKSALPLRGHPCLRALQGRVPLLPLPRRRARLLRRLRQVRAQVEHVPHIQLLVCDSVPVRLGRVRQPVVRMHKEVLVLGSLSVPVPRRRMPHRCIRVQVHRLVPDRPPLPLSRRPLRHRLQDLPAIKHAPCPQCPRGPARPGLSRLAHGQGRHNALCCAPDHHFGNLGIQLPLRL
eukprot:comp22419_c0_seq1/m.54709 comp22419_c0_seq1/g.54709  ORF comp22419_c0_seq1/g.54709 comp22419_c0_seq1/m.54709 type:complete len:342 (+) comp22419_c0_seq1:976-2001(+)